MDIPNGVINEILDDIAEMSGIILFRVKTTWADRGKSGETDSIVLARDAIEAVQRVWEPEDLRDLRTVSVEWLCPIESVSKWDDYKK